MKSRLVQGMLVTTLLLSMTDSPGLALSASQYRQQGLRDREQGQFPEAIAALQQAVELEPDNLSGRVTLGWTLHLAGQDQEAADVLEQTTRLDPGYVPAFNALGIIYLVNADLLPAVMVHTWATMLQPDNEVAYYNLSLAFQRLQQYDWAIATAQKAVTLEPDNPHPLVALAIAQWGQGERTLAEQTYGQAIAMDARYRSSSFLEALAQAGFSEAQIKLAQEVLSAIQ